MSAAGFARHGAACTETGTGAEAERFGDSRKNVGPLSSDGCSRVPRQRRKPASTFSAAGFNRHISCVAAAAKESSIYRRILNYM